MIMQIRRELGEFKVAEFEFYNVYFLGVLKGKPYCNFHAQIEGSAVHIHLYMKRYSKEVLKEMKADFEKMRKMFKKRGVKLILATHTIEGCKLWSRFVQMMGFNEPVEIVLPEGGHGMATSMEV